MLESPQLIAAKARDILRNYTNTVMPDGFKDTVVATSRKACMRSREALVGARHDLVAEIERRRFHPPRRWAGWRGLGGGGAAFAKILPSYAVGNVGVMAYRRLVLALTRRIPSAPIDGPRTGGTCPRRIQAPLP